ncbi:hypothetical protein D9615_004604 [Tricholomella constricta]|uniref:C2H2-type domain-containing protein n=1 Tax=Tricholomella constricta TaxID=117010 RepID=A0A8H5HC35_9AGAR|nr:hypothetical protein D9615_004604 [Tricholomella constricta]
MSDRRVPQYHGYPTQWNSGQQYPASSSYSSTSYQHGGHDVGLPPQVQPAYGAMDAPPSDAPYHADYYATSPSSSQSSTVAHQTVYPTTGQGMSSMRDPQTPQRSGHYHTHPQSHSHGYSPYNQIPPQSHYAQPRQRSQSQAPSYIRTQSVPIAIPQHSPPAHFHSPPQAISISPQYPATPSRPFTCDLCALSFNRQHDLKRHRETHTGEKPYLCNGGCGKTFTRKDALKRHQLVKGCGKVDDAWP